MLLYIYSGFNFVFSDYFFFFCLVNIFHYGTFFGSGTVALSLQEGFLLVFWLQFTFVLFRFFVSLVRLSFTRESAYSVWILTNYTDIFLYLFSLQSNVLAGIITCQLIVYSCSLCALQSILKSNLHCTAMYCSAKQCILKFISLQCTCVYFCFF